MWCRRGPPSFAQGAMRLYVAGSDVDVEVQEWQQHAADQDNDEIHLDDFAESIEDMAAAMELREDAQDPKWQRVFVAVDPEECAVYVFNELGQPVTSARGEISEGRQDLDDVSIGFLSWWKRGLYRLPVTESGAAAAPVGSHSNNEDDGAAEDDGVSEDNSASAIVQIETADGIVNFPPWTTLAAMVEATPSSRASFRTGTRAGEVYAFKDRLNIAAPFERRVFVFVKQDCIHLFDELGQLVDEPDEGTPNGCPAVANAREDRLLRRLG